MCVFPNYVQSVQLGKDALQSFFKLPVLYWSAYFLLHKINISGYYFQQPTNSIFLAFSLGYIICSINRKKSIEPET